MTDLLKSENYSKFLILILNFNAHLICHVISAERDRVRGSPE